MSDGFRAARGEIAGYLDVDLEVHAATSRRWSARSSAGADVATVQRIYAFQVRSLDRYVMSRGYSFLVRRMLARAPSATRRPATSSSAARELLPLLDEIEDSGWFWDTEFMVRARAARACASSRSRAPTCGATTRHPPCAALRDSLRYFVQLAALPAQAAERSG